MQMKKKYVLVSLVQVVFMCAFFFRPSLSDSGLCTITGGGQAHRWFRVVYGFVPAILSSGVVTIFFFFFFVVRLPFFRSVCFYSGITFRG